MGERKHKVDGGEKKVIQPQREEERNLERKPAEAAKLLAANIAQPSDIQVLQRAIGNRAVAKMIQRHSDQTISTYGFKAVVSETGEDVTLHGIS